MCRTNGAPWVFNPHMKLLHIAPSIGRHSETFISDLSIGLARHLGRIDLLVGEVFGGSATIDVLTKANVRLLQAPAFALTKKLDRVLWAVVGGQLWSPERDTRFDRHAAATLKPILSQLGPDVVLLDFGATLARLAPILVEGRFPFVARLHGRDVSGALSDPSYRVALEQGLSESAAIIVASHHMRRLAVLAGAPQDRLHLVRYPVSIEGVRPEPWSVRRICSPSAVFLGRMTPKKQPVALIEAFERASRTHEGATLHLIGDGPELGFVRSRVEALGIRDRVRFYGALPRRDALEIVRKQWIYAQSSVTAFDGDQEGFGISLAEAGLLELPIVSTKHNGIPEQVIQGKTGLLSPEYDFEAMGKNLAALFSDPTRAAQMGTAGRRQIRAICSPEASVETVIDILRYVHN